MKQDLTCVLEQMEWPEETATGSSLDHSQTSSRQKTLLASEMTSYGRLQTTACHFPEATIHLVEKERAIHHIYSSFHQSSYWICTAELKMCHWLCDISIPLLTNLILILKLRNAKKTFKVCLRVVKNNNEVLDSFWS